MDLYNLTLFGKKMDLSYQNSYNKMNNIDVGGPLMIPFTITRKCNFKCIHCYNDSGTGGIDECNDEQLIEIAKQICELQPISICLCGGETLMRQDVIFDVIKILSEHSGSINMVTNAFLANKEVLIKLKESGIKLVQFSLDGYNEFHHDNMRGIIGSYKRVIEAVKDAVEIGLAVSISFIPQKMNYKRVPDLCDICYKLGVQDFRVMPLIPMGRGGYMDDLLLSSEEYLILQQMLAKEKEKYRYKGMDIEWGDPIDHLYRMPQNDMNGMTSYTMEVGPNGDVTVSTYIPIVVGNCFETPLIDIWNSGYSRIWGHKKFLKSIEKLHTIYDFNDFEPAPYSGQVLKLDISK